VQAFFNLWKLITLRHTLALAGSLILAWVLDDLLSVVAKALIDELLFWGSIAALVYYYRKTKQLTYGRHAFVYVPTVAWLTTSAVWYRGWRTEYLPPSEIIDVAVFVFEGASLIFILMALGKEAVEPPKA
jgi:hypothetical protein